MQNRWIKYTLVAAGWFFLGCVLSLEVYFNNRAWGMRVDFVDISIPQFGRAAMWAAMAPLILRMREKLPLNTGRWGAGIGFHFAMSFVVMATYYLGRMLAYVMFSDETLTDF